eukprot:140037-Chlamydomonas_euryale.AAC.2
MLLTKRVVFGCTLAPTPSNHFHWTFCNRHCQVAREPITATLVDFHESWSALAGGTRNPEAEKWRQGSAA